MVRYRCTACGNLTRFDVVTRERSRAFHHFSLAGDVTIEDRQILEQHVEEVTCRWCGATGAAIDATAVSGAPAPAPARDGA